MTTVDQGQPDIAQMLIDAIRTKDDNAAERAVKAFAGRSDLLPALRPLLADSDMDRRWWAVRTLAILGGAEAEAAAAEHLEDPDEATRCAAALALGQLAAAAAVPALTARLADSSGWVRDSAGDALALIGEPALPALVEALASQHDGVRVRAAAALRKIAITKLSGAPVTEYSPSYWPAINALFIALNDPNHLVRHSAYEALDHLGLLDSVLIAP